ncbi:FG-GAP-like repeat-containing protein [bacterium]|nr:FG-GAP-like repeat-containing protein [bacterium]
MLLLFTLTVGIFILRWQENKLEEVNASPEEIFKQAEQAIEDHDNLKARSLLKLCLDRDPDHVMAKLYFGQFLRESGETEQALELWRSIQSDDPSHLATARMLEGTVALERGRLDQSRDLFRESISLNPDYLDARERLLFVYAMLRRPKELVAELKEIRARRPLRIQELVFETLPYAISLPSSQSLSPLEVTLKENLADSAAQEAYVEILNEDGKVSEALEFISRIQDKYTLTDKLISRQILLLVESRMVQEAVKICRSTRVKSSKSEDVWYACGRVAYELGHWEIAVNFFQNVEAVDNNFQENCYYLGMSLERMGQSEKSKLLLEKSIFLDDLETLCLRITQLENPNSPKVLPILIQIAEKLQKLDRFDDAVQWYSLARKIAPNDQRLKELFEATKQLSSTVLSKELNSRPSFTIPVIPDSILPNLKPGKSQEKLPIPGSTIKFVDVHDKAKINGQYFNGNTGRSYLIESMGGGIIVLDYDADGWEDLYFPQGCKIPYEATSTEHIDQFYRNQDGNQFVDATSNSGVAANAYGLGGTALDFNNDGFDDFVVSNMGKNYFYFNNGDGTFTDIGDRVFFQTENMSTSVAAADFNGDSFLDLYVTNYVTDLKTCPLPDGTFRPCDPASFEGQKDQILLSDGSGFFKDSSEESGINLPNGKGLGVVVADFDSDQRMDIYVSNDGVPNFLFKNTATSNTQVPVFEERGLLSGSALDRLGKSQAGMGISVADFNQDQLLDIYVTNFYDEHNTLYSNFGDLNFQDDTRRHGLYNPTLSVLGFGTQACDFDCDGDADLIVANGHIFDDESGNQPWKMTAQIFRNFGDGQFNETSIQAGDYFNLPCLGRGVATLDWNRDALPDVIIVHQDRPVALLENRTKIDNQVMSLQLVGTESNRDSIGAVLYQVSDADQRTQIPVMDGNYLSCNSRDRTFAFPPDDLPRKFEVLWPIGRKTSHILKRKMLEKNGNSRWRLILTEDGDTFFVPISAKHSR